MTRPAAVPDRLRARVLDRLAARLVDGVLTVTASEHRAQLDNRRAARDRLADVLRRAAAPPPRQAPADPPHPRVAGAPAGREEAARRDQARPPGAVRLTWERETQPTGNEQRQPCERRHVSDRRRAVKVDPMFLTHLRRNVVAYLALVVALGTGTAYAAAAIPDGSVTAAKLHKNAVTSNKIKDGSIKPKDIKKPTYVQSSNLSARHAAGRARRGQRRALRLHAADQGPHQRHRVHPDASAASCAAAAPTSRRSASTSTTSPIAGTAATVPAGANDRSVLLTGHPSAARGRARRPGRHHLRRRAPRPTCRTGRQVLDDHPGRLSAARA